MTHRSGVRTSSLAAPGRLLVASRRRMRDVSAAIGAVFFCSGLVLIPALAALDLTVGLACQGLDHAACIALFQPPSQ